MTLADQIMLMNQGRIVQCAPPRALYDDPSEVFGGWFLGNPGMNFFEHPLAPSGGAAELRSPLFPGPLRLVGAGLGEKVTLGVRPEHLLVREAQGPRTVRAVVRRRTLGVGGQVLLSAEAAGQPFKVKVPPEAGGRVGAEAWLECPLRWVRVFGADGKRLEVQLSEAPA